MKVNIIIGCDNLQQAKDLLLVLAYLISDGKEEHEQNIIDVNEGQMLNIMNKVAYIEANPVRKKRNENRTRRTTDN